MSKLYRSREGEATALDTKTQLTTLGSDTAPGPLLVPSGATSIVGIIVAAMGNMAAATSASGLIRLEGPALQGGPETFTIGTWGQAVATGGNFAGRSVLIPCNIPCTPANEVLIFAEMSGTDIGQVSVGVTLVFGTGS